ncbi:DUF420 domain-containing protein [Alicyclobacillus mengziensis]|uniref:DUF420 domain-containing protein n=1 Tax=Alicyclobacillus mengziensis TaxID=2931921 RepID=A0A9X7Z715_9BACL|nr:DUF420 domain-containing protein [Alicyclobacillus mengziensis]QSO46835.1 DUF420 domain-containing protein [Alicyclobacillus mengziensis]
MSVANIVLSYFNEACIISSAIVFAFGWMHIRKKRVETHRRFMITGSILASLFFITYVLKTFLIGDTAFGGPKHVASFYYAFLQSHSILATVAAILGIITLTWAFKARFERHRRIGPWTVTIWFITAATGLTVFILLYIAFPPGPTTNLWRAWIG